MSFLETAASAAWNVLPAALFHPKEGHKTLGGNQFCTLQKRPPLGYADESSYAVFTDTRFRMRHLFHKFAEFLPAEFTIIDPPNGQNCFMHALNIDPKTTRKFGRDLFDEELTKRGYQCIDYEDTQPQAGDIIVYSVEGIIDSIREHAALYVGDGRVRSRWGYHSPLVEHPLKAVLSGYWNLDDRYLAIERKT